MKKLLTFMAFLLLTMGSGCALSVHRPVSCPPLPTIGADESLKIYTARIIDLYDRCASSVSAN